MELAWKAASTSACRFHSPIAAVFRDPHHLLNTRVQLRWAKFLRDAILLRLICHLACNREGDAAQAVYRGSKGAFAAPLVADISANARAPAINILSVTRRAPDAMMPRPTPGKMYELLVCAATKLRPP
jgi:hypothetical protein